MCFERILGSIAALGLVLILLTGVAPAQTLISRCDTTEAWLLQPMGQAKCALSLKETDRGSALNVSYQLTFPDLNKFKSSGIELIYKKADFTLGEGSALIFDILWEGGDNPFKIEIVDENNEARFFELTQLNKRDGWQTVIVPAEDFDAAAEKVLKGAPGRIKVLKFITYYWWNSDPRSFTLGEISAAERKAGIDPLISASQLGYRPEDPKRVVVKSEGPYKGKKQFSVIRLSDAEAVYKGKLAASNVAGWPGSFMRGDFSEVREPGRYVIQVESRGRRYVSEPFSIEKRIFDVKAVPLDLEFIKGFRSDDPLIFGFQDMGGYRDAGTMLARYLSTNTHMLYGLSCYVLARALPRSEAMKDRYAIDELRYSARSMISWQKPDGSVVSTIVRDPDLYAHNQFPEDNDYPWIKTEGGDMSTYVAALSAASRALAPYDKALSDKALKSAEKAYAYIEKLRLAKRTSAAGNLLWDTMELYKATKNERYLAKARELAAKVAAAQFLDFTRVKEAPVCGNFSNSPRSLDFSYQYKLIHDIGAYFGLIELYRELKPADPLYGDVRFFLKAFAEQYLLAMSSLTPYGEIAEGLEKNEDGTLRVSYFHPPTGRLGVKSHGLNCDHLAYGLMGLRLSEIFNDPRLAGFASDQMQWVFGVNPLGVSMMSGIGGRQALGFEEYLNLPYKPGGVFNGIVGRGGIAPYWAMHWVSGEYWVPHNAYFTALAGELDGAPKAGIAEETPLSVRIELPKRIDGGKEIKVVWTIENKTGEAVKTSAVLRARGAYMLDETALLELKAGESRKIEKVIPPAQRRAPCLVSASTPEGVSAEVYFLPEYPAYTEASREKLTKYAIAAVKASSEQQKEKNVKAANAIDGQMTTRWSSDFIDASWIIADLGAVKPVRMVKLHWETAYSEAYELQLSDDGKEWKTVYSVDDEDGATDEISLKDGSAARYVKVNMKRRGTQYGNSLYEIEIFGK